MRAVRSTIGNAHVMHRRMRPRPHVLHVPYPVMRFDLDELGLLDRKLKLFSRDKLNFVSLRTSDYGQADGSVDGIAALVAGKLAKLKLDVPVARTELLTYPRICGFAFNPISCILCRDREDRLVAVIFAVNSTFGERHHYSFVVDNPDARVHKFTAGKMMRVSPFNRVEGHYRFQLRESPTSIVLTIDYHTGEGLVLSTSLNARLSPVSDGQLIKHYGLLPVAMFRTLFSIHWHALRLWLKGVPFVGRDAAYAPAITPQHKDRAKHV